MDYFLWETGGDLNDESLCFIEDAPEGMGLDETNLQWGKSAKKVYPKDAKIYLRKENPGLALPGFIGNTKNLLILSKAGLAVLEKYCEGQKYEVFPFDLVNHKKRVHSRDYVIFNPLTFVAALDLNASDLVLRKNGEVGAVKTYVLSAAKLGDAPHLFRLAEKPTSYIFSRELGRAFNAAGVSNIFGKQLRQV